MATHISAIKRNRQNQKRALRNQAIKTRVKNIIKDTRDLSKSGKVDKDTINKAISLIAKSVSKGAINKKAAARKISKIARLANLAK